MVRLSNIDRQQFFSLRFKMPQNIVFWKIDFDGESFWKMIYFIVGIRSLKNLMHF